MRRRDSALDALLARGRLGAPQKERMWQRLRRSLLLRGLLGTKRGRFAIALPLAAAAMAALVLRVQVDRSGGFTAKGQGSGVVEIECDRGTLGSCPVGSTLIFLHAKVAKPAFLSAYADPIRYKGERVWYFPTEAGVAPRIEPTSPPGALREAIVIGPEQPPGEYRVHVLLTERPVNRRGVLAPDSAAVLDRADFDLRVVPR